MTRCSLKGKAVAHQGGAGTMAIGLWRAASGKYNRTGHKNEDQQPTFIPICHLICPIDNIDIFREHHPMQQCSVVSHPSRYHRISLPLRKGRHAGCSVCACTWLACKGLSCPSVLDYIFSLAFVEKPLLHYYAGAVGEKWYMLQSDDVEVGYQSTRMLQQIRCTWPVTQDQCSVS